MKLIDSRKKKLALNITPLVDVLFILIIFFTVTSTFLEQPGIKLELPKAATSSPQKVEKAVLVVGADNKLFFQNREVDMKNLPETLAAAMENSSEKSLIVSADKEVHHGLVVNIMDIARQNGVKKLIISTEPKK